MNDPASTLDQARTELAQRECGARGHDLTLTDTRTRGGDHAPVSVHCERCTRHWDVGAGHGGINLGEPR